MTHVKPLKKEMLCWWDPVTIHCWLLGSSQGSLASRCFQYDFHQVALADADACLLGMIYNCLFKGDWLPIVIRGAIKVMTIIEWDYQLLVSQPQSWAQSLQIKDPNLPWDDNVTWHPEAVSAWRPSGLCWQSMVAWWPVIIMVWWICWSEMMKG